LEQNKWITKLVVIQNDQVEWVNNLSTLQGGTYGKQVSQLSLMRKLLPIKHAFYPGLKNYSHQETKLLNLKISTNVKNVPISG
jgi:hypothetical protein